MMSVLEYAVDVNRNVEDILTLCKKLNIGVNSEEDMLDDDMIILLDNELANEDLYEDEDDMLPNDFEDSYVEELEEVKPIKKKAEAKSKNNDFLKQRKNMYKHKEKLQSNKVEDDDNIVIYTQGMSVSDFANLLGVSR